jgi:hypothetical protein
MEYEGVTIFGMSLYWWAFWLSLILLFFVFARPVTRRRYRRLRDLERQNIKPA